MAGQTKAMPTPQDRILLRVSCHDNLPSADQRHLAKMVPALNRPGSSDGHLSSTGTVGTLSMYHSLCREGHADQDEDREDNPLAPTPP